MTAPDQLTMFEPVGPELLALVRVKVASSEALRRQSDLLALRGFLAAMRAADRASSQAQEQAEIFETALQFEELAGLG